MVIEFLFLLLILDWRCSDQQTDRNGMYDFFASHRLIVDRTANDIKKYCHFWPNVTVQSPQCSLAYKIMVTNTNAIDIYNIYYPTCVNGNLTQHPRKATVMNYDSCIDYYTSTYLNQADVQRAMHTNVTKIAYKWESCSNVIMRLV